jgi:hypothetical protein
MNEVANRLSVCGNERRRRGIFITPGVRPGINTALDGQPAQRATHLKRGGLFFCRPPGAWINLAQDPQAYARGY